jgi:hypothetical protein
MGNQAPDMDIWGRQYLPGTTFKETQSLQTIEAG